jgi:hypothetical protein
MFAELGEAFGCEKAAVDESDIRIVVTTRVLSFMMFVSRAFAPGK